MRNDRKTKDKSEWTDEAHFKKFHENCGGLKTIVLIRAKNGKIFGGYNDVPWHKGGKVSTGRRDKRLSFLFLSKRNYYDNEEFDENDTDIFDIKRCNPNSEFEIFLSDESGPHFQDIKIDGPEGVSHIRNAKNYGLKAGDIVDEKESPLDVNGNQEFRYSIYEVYEVQEIPLEERL